MVALTAASFNSGAGALFYGDSNPGVARAMTSLTAFNTPGNRNVAYG